MDLIVKFTLQIFAFVALIFAVVIHEVAHGYVAFLLGDPTAKRAHRLTLNPIAHIDLFGSIILPLLLFFTNNPLLGWAKPVPFNPAYFRDPRRGIMLVGAAGPAANFATALLCAAILHLTAPLPHLAAVFLFLFCATNVILGIFNLIPIPPLDGSRVVLGLLPDDLARSYLKIEPFGFILIFGLLWLGVLNYIISPIASFLQQWLLPMG